MGEITSSPLFWIGLILLIIGFIIVSATLTVIEDYRLKRASVPWWILAISIGAFGLFMIGLIMIVMAIAGGDISRNVYNRLVEANVVPQKIQAK